MPSTRISLLVAATALLLNACAAPLRPITAAPVTPVAAAAAAAVTTPGPVIVKPAIDTRSYRAVTLANGLRAVIISDPSADKSAASLVVHRGSFDEPQTWPGLAHFLEHMLFLGTKKYPTPDEYAAFVNSHGGSNNAYTAGDHTNFFFDIAPEHFAAALDRFAQFFIAPTFDATYVDKEMNAVNSEYQMQIKQDEWRNNAAQQRVMNPAHPAARFSIGSIGTLRDKPNARTRDALLAYYTANYVPENMTLAVYGREDLDALEHQVRDLFDAVPVRASTARATPPAAFTAGSLPRWLDIKPVRDERSVGFTFPLPGLDAAYREKPAEYLGNLIGHEGAGSLHSVLKAKGWIESLAAGAGRIDTANAEFVVEVHLTQAGEQHVKEIGAALFSYLALLRREGIVERLYQEQTTIAKIAFDYQEQGKAIGYVMAIAASMNLYPPADVLRAPAAFDHYDPALIRKTLAALNVDNLLLTHVSPDVKPAATEPWFNVPYRIGNIPVDYLRAWRTPAPLAGIALPEPNPFLPENVALVNSGPQQAVPAALAGPAGLRLWHLPDTEFRAPRADVVIRIATPLVRDTAADAVYAALYVELVRDALDSYSYPAELAGLNYDIRTTDKGLVVMLGGFNDKEPVLLDKVLEQFSNVAIDPEKFALHRVELIRGWQNSHQARPYEQALAELPLALLKPRWSPDQLRAAAGRATVKGLHTWRGRALASVGVDVLAHGNVDAAEAARLAAIVGNRLHVCGSCVATPAQTRRITARLVRKLDIAHDDASLVLYAQGDSRQYSERARFGLLSHLIRDPYFQAIRTEQQLGYVVSVSPAVIERVPGITFVVQSPAAGPAQISAATFAFLAQWRTALATLSDADYAGQRAGLVARLLEKDRNLASRSARFWTDLDDGITSFDSRQKIADEINLLSKADFIKFYDSFLSRVQQRRLMVLSTGKFGPIATPLGADSQSATAGWQVF